MDDMTNFLTASENLSFLIAGCVVLGILCIEIISMILGHSVLMSDHHVDLTADINGNGIPDHLELGHAHLDLMSWANPAHVPFMVFLVVACAIFSTLGYAGQWIFGTLTGHLAPLILSLPVALGISMPLCRVSTIGLARIMPRDTTSAVTIDSLIGQQGVVNVGPVSQVSSGIARFTDSYGTDHNLIVYAEADAIIPLNSSVVLMGPHRDKAFASIVRPI